MLNTMLRSAGSIAGFAIGDLTERPSLGEDVSASEFTDFFQKFKGLGVAATGICTLTSLLFFIISLTKLSTSAGNDRARATALKGLLYSGIALALFGGATVIIGIFWNAI